MVYVSPFARWIRFASLLVLLTLVATAIPNFSSAQARGAPAKAAAPAAQPAQPPAAKAKPILTEATAPFSFDGDLRTLAQPAPGQAGGDLTLPDPERAEQESGRGAAAGAPATSLRHADPGRANAVNAMPAPSVVFDGLSNADNFTVFGGTVNPPDPTGDVGPNHYVQAVNLPFRIFDKSGTPLTPPTKISSLFAAGPTNTPCDTADNGDPIVVYDTMADRWLITQFAVPGPDYYECIAVSKTGDPVAGGWWLYVVKSPFRIFNDYPKVTVWPDAYYLSAPMFPDAGGGIYGAVWALDRAAMLAGLPMRQYYVTTGNAFPRVLPSNLRGQAPPAGSPAYVMSFQLP
ncbi:MAG TPA: hypothetical protein VD886_25230, partial [Herpetosiphonaceae bacterium]|nr:hypothetical protein [Herpetosiphonaceae bacterium]